MPTLRHVVAGTDFSEGAERALELAIAIAAAARLPLTVVHVCELGIDGRDEQLIRDRGEALVEVVAKHQQSGVAITAVLRIGTASKKLDNVAAEVGASVIVVGRAGSGRSAIVGSVASELIRSAHRPVLTVT